MSSRSARRRATRLAHKAERASAPSLGIEEVREEVEAWAAPPAAAPELVEAATEAQGATYVEECAGAQIRAALGGLAPPARLALLTQLLARELASAPDGGARWFLEFPDVLDQGAELAP